MYVSSATYLEDAPAEAPLDAALARVRRELMTQLARSNERPARIFAHRYTLTLVPLALTTLLLWRWPGILTGLAFAIVAGFTQNALGVLMHEGSHYFFHSNRRINDLLANVFVCLPVFNTVQGYRQEHFHHHRRSGEDDDPYHDLYGGYARPEDMTRGLIRDVLGISAVCSFFRRYSGPSAARSGQPGAVLALAAVQGVIAAASWATTGWWFAWVVLWVLPLMTIPVAINRMRTFVEHYPGFEALPANRTTITGLLEYLCVAPYGYSHHFEHHFAPNVPYYRLAWAHEFIESQGIRLRAHQYNSAGYLRTFRRMMRELAAISTRAA
jgi:fatty acid desaturase